MTSGRDLTGVVVYWSSFFDEAQRELACVAEVEVPAVDARRIVEAASGTDAAHFESVLSQPVTKLAAARFHDMLQRRCAGEPLQYVVGSWGFRTLDLMVDQRVLIPRPETEVVAGIAIAEVQRRARTRTRQRRHGRSGETVGEISEIVVVDLGTGTGAIALSVAVECPGVRVHATDVSTQALAVARANLAGLGRAAARVSLHEGDWYDALPNDLRNSVDVVVSNPPYIGTGEVLPAVVADWEPPVALWAGPRGDEAVRRVICGSMEWLKADGVVIVEVASHRARQCAVIATEAGLSDVYIELDLAGRERVVLGRRS